VSIGQKAINSSKVSSDYKKTFPSISKDVNHNRGGYSRGELDTSAFKTDDNGNENGYDNGSDDEELHVTGPHSPFKDDDELHVTGPNFTFDRPEVDSPTHDKDRGALGGDKARIELGLKQAFIMADSDKSGSVSVEEVSVMGY
jgi:hypothetical protein